MRGWEFPVLWVPFLEECSRDFPLRKDSSELSESAKGSSHVEGNSLESASREAYFSRVETFTPLQWAGQPLSLSPLLCARFGWASVGPALLRCCACHALLGTATRGDTQHRERCAELRRALSSAHERFCFWPDSPCPAHFALLPLDEPRLLLREFRERFQRLCRLELQLPRLAPEQLGSLALSEDTLGLLLELLEEDPEPPREGEKPPGTFSKESPQGHVVAACVLALCGWDCSASSSPGLPVISCSRCMRKVGLWAFHQLESAAPEPDPTPAPSERVPPAATSPVSPSPVSLSPMSPSPMSPRRIGTRSQDTLPPTAEQEKSPSPSVSRPVSRDCGGSLERGELEAAVPALRSRPVTRSMGQGDTAEVPSSPVRRAKRARLCSSGGSDASPRSFFQPSSQHRAWCPWVSSGEGQESLDDDASQPEKPGKAEPGWKMVLNALLGTRRGDAVPDTEPVSLSEKSCKVFRIFRQWESMNSS
ncbi:zinc finger C3HC-type protein 1 isoform X2 [Myiozetetes cayanensis]|uniref:zinc finger C3HC-type protein 1 isoform X2 n=1 Tax=Myiozetetes cayanensis TaxID=478635 RepID=UPI00215ECC27|nr:zinc finger C3HC-type protein 1 isoform X2 [Myiozetetes cayanensis]